MFEARHFALCPTRIDEKSNSNNGSYDDADTDIDFLAQVLNQAIIIMNPENSKGPK